MKQISVAGLPNSYVPVQGPVVVRMHLQLLDLPPMLNAPRASKGFIENYGRRLIEFHADSPCIGDLEELIRWVNRKYYRGTTHTFFEEIDITQEEYLPKKKYTVMTLGVGS